jgi:WD40 repeat protein
VYRIVRRFGQGLVVTIDLTQQSADTSAPAAYDAFLSYTHRDRPVATGIQRGLHQVGRRLGALRALRVFRDDTNLEVSPDLWGRITEAMDRARYLVVVLSPNAAQSYWVNREVQYWLEHNPRDRLLLVLAAGHLEWDADAHRFDPATSDAALPALTQPGVVGAQPLTIDVADDAPWDPRSVALRDKLTTLAAPIHSQTPDELASLDRREQRRFRRLRTGAVTALAMLTVTAVVLAVVAFIQNDRAITQRNRAIASRLNAEAAAMLIKDQPGGDERALQQLLAARLISTPDDGVLLNALAQRATTAKIIDAGAPVFGMAVSPDGRLIATAEKDHTVRLWDATSGEPVGSPLRGHTAQVASVAFSSDGRRLASGADDKTIRLWDVQSRRAFGVPMSVSPGAAISLEFSPDGHTLASAGSDGALGLWNADTGATKGTLQTGTRQTRAILAQVAYSPDDHRIAYAREDDHTIHIVDVDTLRETIAPLSTGDFPTMSVAFSPDGRIAAGSDLVRVWAADTGEQLGELGGYNGLAMTVAFSPDGGRIAAAGTDGAVRLWSATTGKPQGAPLLGHTDAVRQLAFSRDGSRLVSAGLDSTVRVWSLARILGHGDASGVAHVAFDPTGRRVAEANGNGTVVIWNRDNGQLIRVLTGHRGVVWSVAFSPDGHRLASAGADGTIRIWNADTGDPMGALRGHNGAVHAIAYSADGHRLASGGADHTVRLWNADTGRPLVAPLQGHDETVRSVAFGPHGNLLVSGGEDGTIRLWDAHTGEPHGALDGKGNVVDGVTFSPDGRRFASTSGNDVRLWNTNDGSPVGNPLAGHTDTVTAVAFSPDGRRLASASMDQTVRLWDADSGRPVGDAFTGHAGGVYSVAFSPDGQTVASSGADEMIRLWDAAAQPQRLCDKLTSDITTDQWREWIGDEIKYTPVCPKLPAGGPPPPAPQFTVLPIAGLNRPQAVAVDRSGDLYVADMKNNRVLRVAASTGATSTLPLGDIHEPAAVALDDAGDVFVGTGDNKVYKLPSGAKGSVRLPLSDLHSLGDITADGAGNLYVGDGNRILKLRAGSTSPDVLSLRQDARIGGLAIDGRGDVFASDQRNDQVVELPLGSTPPTVLPFHGLNTPGGLTVDAQGDVFVADTDDNRVLELPSGWRSDTELPFDGLKEPYAVAVGPTGDLYVADAGNNRVLKLPAAAR